LIKYEKKLENSQSPRHPTTILSKSGLSYRNMYMMETRNVYKTFFRKPEGQDHLVEVRVNRRLKEMFCQYVNKEVGHSYSLHIQLKMGVFTASDGCIKTFTVIISG